MSELAAGVNINNLRREHIEDTPVSIPPLPEQHRIVAEIEKQFTRLDASVAALRRTQANLKRYRASTLRAACSGELVPTEAELARAEGREYEPARVLLERILTERRARWESQEKRRGKYKEPAAPDTSGLPPLPEGWAWATVNALTEIIRGISFPKNAKTFEPRDGYVACLRTANVQREVDWHDLWFVSNEYVKSDDKYIRDGDVLMSVSNSLELLGKVARVTNRPWVSTLGAFISAIRPCMEIDATCCYYILSSPVVQSRIRNAGSTTTNISNISSGKLSEIPIPLPPLAEQRRIAVEVERRLSVIQQAEAAVDASLQRAERLRQSILKRAFSGELVPQDPDDEPASVLLERIRAQREAEQAAATASKQRPARRRQASSQS